MSQLFQMNMPKYPECWETCGNCAQGEVFVLEMLVAPGDHVVEDDNVLTLETGNGKLFSTWLTGTITTGNSCCAIWRAATGL